MGAREQRQYSVEVAPGLVDDLRDIRNYITDVLGSPAAAASTTQAILSKLRSLERFPLRNRVLATLRDGRQVRRAASGNYVILYIVEGSRVSAFAVLYGRANVEERLASLSDRI